METLQERWERAKAERDKAQHLLDTTELKMAQEERYTPGAILKAQDQSGRTVYAIKLSSVHHTTASTVRPASDNPVWVVIHPDFSGATYACLDDLKVHLYYLDWEHQL